MMLYLCCSSVTPTEMTSHKHVVGGLAAVRERGTRNKMISLENSDHEGLGT